MSEGGAGGDTAVLMPLVKEFLRIDDRLIHGQIILGWAPKLEARLLIVADDEAAGDPVLSECLVTTSSGGPEIKVLGVQEAARFVAANRDGEGVLVLFRHPDAALRYVGAGRVPLKINVGCLRFEAGRKQLSRAVSVGQGERDAFLRLAGLGVALEIRMVPTDKPQDLVKLL